MWPFLLLASTLILFLVPLIPALLELRLRRDVRPLGINPEHTGHARFFADAFHSHLGRQGSEPREVVMAETAMLPNHAQFDQEILAERPMGTGINSRLRGVLAKSHLVIRRDSVLLRWAHGKSVGIEDGCLLLGRISADDKIVLRKGTRFARLNAPAIFFGDARGVDDAVLPSVVAADQVLANEGRQVHGGDAELAEKSITRGDLVVRGDLRIGRGAIVTGSVKSQGKMILAPDVTVTGALVSEGRMTIGEGCRVGGPVVSERAICIGPEVLIGAAGHRATVTAPEIEIAEGSIVCGTVWARDQGRVVARAVGD